MGIFLKCLRHLLIFTFFPLSILIEVIHSEDFRKRDMHAVKDLYQTPLCSLFFLINSRSWSFFPRLYAQRCPILLNHRTAFLLWVSHNLHNQSRTEVHLGGFQSFAIKNKTTRTHLFAGQLRFLQTEHGVVFSTRAYTCSSRDAMIQLKSKDNN